MSPNPARRGDPALPTKPGNAAAVIALGITSNNHTKAHSLVERFRDVKGIDLMGLGHNRVLGLDVAFRHDACAVAMSLGEKESSESARC